MSLGLKKLLLRRTSSRLIRRTGVLRESASSVLSSVDTTAMVVVVVVAVSTAARAGAGISSSSSSRPSSEEGTLVEANSVGDCGQSCSMLCSCCEGVVSMRVISLRAAVVRAVGTVEMDSVAARMLEAMAIAMCVVVGEGVEERAVCVRLL